MSNNPLESVCTREILSAMTRNRGSCINVVRWYNSGKKLHTASSRGELGTWNAQTLRQEDMKQFHSEAVTALEVSHKEHLLITGDIRGNLKFFKDLSYSKEIKLHRSNGAILDISFAPHDHRFAVTLADSHTKIIDSITGREEADLGLRSFDATCCAWHPGLRLVATGAKSERVRLWDPRAGTEVAALFAHKQAVSRVRFAAGGQTLISAGRDQVVRVLDLRTLRFISTLRGHADPVTDIAPHPVYSGLLASCDQAGGIFFWDIHPRVHPVLTPSNVDTSFLNNASLGNLNSSAGPGAGSSSIMIADGIVTDYQLLSALAEKIPPSLAASIAAQISAIAPASQPSLMSGTSSLFTATEGVQKAILPIAAIHNGHSGCVKSIRWSPSGDLLASGGDDCTIRLWSRPSPSDDFQFSSGASMFLAELWNVPKVTTEFVCSYNARLNAAERALDTSLNPVATSASNLMTSGGVGHEPGASFGLSSGGQQASSSQQLGTSKIIDNQMEWTKLGEMLPAPVAGVPLSTAHSSMQVVVRRPLNPTICAPTYHVKKQLWPMKMENTEPIFIATVEEDVQFANHAKIGQFAAGGVLGGNWGDVRKVDSGLNILARTTTGLSGGVLAKPESWDLSVILEKEKKQVEEGERKQKEQEAAQAAQLLKMTASNMSVDSKEEVEVDTPLIKRQRLGSDDMEMDN